MKIKRYVGPFVLLASMFYGYIATASVLSFTCYQGFRGWKSWRGEG